jgi:hypothetical protein
MQRTTYAMRMPFAVCCSPKRMHRCGTATSAPDDSAVRRRGDADNVLRFSQCALVLAGLQVLEG